MKTEQLKVIAEAMGIKVQLDKKAKVLIILENVNSWIIDEFPSGQLVWNPETDWSQTGMVLKWLEELDCHVTFAYSMLAKEWRVAIVSTAKRIEIRLQHKDFQTAICMVAFEIIKIK